ncbi:folate-binding protein [Hyphococcus formosus]|uniref:CAF17-like 4Fe-4S cluster assembly/insertion protein YgfZ n=1 Tax=Hyphococcus formosus TaxID=3143534 RepID=UPI00398AF732
MSNIEHLKTRRVIRLEGDDRRSFLQGLITQDIDQLTRENAIASALLTPQGKILADFFVAEIDDAFLIDCHHEISEALMKRLSMYKLRAKVTLSLDDTLCVFASAGPIESAASTFKDPREESLGWRAIAEPDLGSVSEAEYHARRITLGVPEFGYDYDADDKFLTDVNADHLNIVHYKKGCFIGQEVTSRMKRKGEVRKRTLMAQFDQAAPAKGTPVTAGTSTLGDVLSSSNGRALAFIRVERWEKAMAENTTIEAEGTPLQLRFPDYLKQD